MVDVKEAAKTASDYLAGLYSLDAWDDLRLEEVELTEDEKYWLITLSYQDKKMIPRRQYKIFKINAETGKVQSMKIRTVS
jgi:hypothetical protein